MKPTKTADEHLAELMPIFERIRAQEQVPCAFPIHMGAGGTVFVRCNSSRSVPLSPHVMHCHPTTHWVSRVFFLIPVPNRNTRNTIYAYICSVLYKISSEVDIFEIVYMESIKVVSNMYKGCYSKTFINSPKYLIIWQFY